MKTDKMIKLLRLRNHLTRVIAENNYYLTIRPLESVKAYNRQLEAELSAVERIIKGEFA
ncbi:MAG: hypothetical protein PHF29_09245 [Candidatus Riflebacteria bacterium]|nr:hypothetical protein [Candidatus Riflebacteria bacterium]